jgi:hypothetical protein
MTDDRNEPPSSACPSTPSKEGAAVRCPTCGAFPPLEERLAVSIERAAWAIDVSRDTIELLLGVGALKSVRVRSRRRVLVGSIQDYLAGRGPGDVPHSAKRRERWPR